MLTITSWDASSIGVPSLRVCGSLNISIMLGFVSSPLTRVFHVKKKINNFCLNHCTIINLLQVTNY